MSVALEKMSGTVAGIIINFIVFSYNFINEVLLNLSIIQVMVCDFISFIGISGINRQSFGFETIYNKFTF